jgi:hypothetical protein
VSNPTQPNSEKYKSQNKSKTQPILGCNEKNKVQKKHPKTDWLTVEDVKVHKWMKI